MTGRPATGNETSREGIDLGPDRDADAERRADEDVEALEAEAEVPLDAPIEVPVADLVGQIRTVPLPEDEDR